MISEFNSGTQSKHARLLYFGLAVLIAGLYDFLFWDKHLGLNFLIFVSSYVIGFLLIAAHTKQIKNKLALYLLVPISILSIDVVLFNNTLVQNWVPLIVFLLLTSFSILITFSNPEKISFSITKLPMVRNLFSIFQKTNALYEDLFEWKGNVAIYKRIGLGFLISLPILIIFALLFSLADQIFADWVNQALELNIEETTIARTIRSFVIALSGSLFFYSLISKSHQLKERVTRVLRLDTIISATVLVLINLLFITFVFIQIKYLFGDAELISDYNLTFANYARRGFFELVWVMILASGLFGFFYRSFEHHKRSKLIDFLQAILMFQVGIIAISALKRMNLYQAAYGYTVLRLYVEWFIYFAVLLLLTAVTSTFFKAKFKHLVHGSLCLGIVAITIVSSINVDYLIAKKNISKFNKDTYAGKSRIDFQYLADLSIDVVPALDHIEFEKIYEDNYSESILWGIQNLLEEEARYANEHDSFLEFNTSVEKAKEFLPKTPH